MADVKWIKIVTDIFDDEKIRYIETLPNGDETIVIWFRILCLAGKSNSSGILMMTDRIAYTDEMLSSIFNRDIKSVQLALNLFKSLEMIEMIDNKIYVSNWSKHQNLDKLEQKKLYDREYQKKKRNESNSMLENRTTIVRQSYDARSLDIDIDKELDKDIDKDIELDKTKSYRFIKPTLEQLTNFIEEEKLNVDAQYFIDYYESNGWNVGKAKMKDWKATVRNWNRRNFTQNNYSKKVRQEIVTEIPIDTKTLSISEKEDIMNALKNLGKQ